VLIQIALLDVVFSLDSVITAVGMVDDIWVMVAAIIIAVVVMLIFAEPISRFVESHPTLKMLALSFLILIGVMLVAEGVGAHMDKGYIYFAMFFALIVEVLNISIRTKDTDDEDFGDQPQKISVTG
jgi:predicted tellurium resistance membrane protein TerC